VEPMAGGGGELTMMIDLPNGGRLAKTQRCIRKNSIRAAS
jgi:hypothetical protein